MPDTIDNNSPPPRRPPPRCASAAAAFAVFAAAALLLRAPALLRAADNLPLDSPRRQACLFAMRNIAAFSHALRLDAPSLFFESIEREHLE